MSNTRMLISSVGIIISLVSIFLISYSLWWLIGIIIGFIIISIVEPEVYLTKTTNKKKINKKIK